MKTTLKNIVLIALACVLTFTLTATGRATDNRIDPESIYGRAGIVVAVDGNKITVEDDVGFLWSFYSEFDDWIVGDGAAMVMQDTAGTRNITDDIVIDAHPFRLDLVIQITDAWK